MVIAIIVVLSVLAWDLMRKSTPRANFNSTSAELQGVLSDARQQALMYGVNVGVMLFPTYSTGFNATGLLIEIRDDTNPANSIFSTSAALNLANYNPAVLATSPNGEILTTYDLPQDVLMGPVTGLGSALPFPYQAINTQIDCSFCDPGGDRRGAVYFDPRGYAWFCSVTGSGVTATVGCTQGAGGSFSIYSTDLGIGNTYTTTTFVITSPAGSVRVFHNG